MSWLIVYNYRPTYLAVNNRTVPYMRYVGLEEVRSRQHVFNFPPIKKLRNFFLLCSSMSQSCMFEACLDLILSKWNMLARIRLQTASALYTLASMNYKSDFSTSTCATFTYFRKYFIVSDQPLPTYQKEIQSAGVSGFLRLHTCNGDRIIMSI